MSRSNNRRSQPHHPLLTDQSTNQPTQRVDFGTITEYVAPKPTFAGSIMNLSNTGAYRQLGIIPVVDEACPPQSNCYFAQRDS